MEVENNLELCRVGRRRCKYFVLIIKKIDSMFEVKRIV